MNNIDLIACLISEDVNEVSELPMLWYENDKGERWYPDFKRDNPADHIPEGYKYQHSQFPNELRHSILRIITQDDVSGCVHSDDKIVPTTGWIEGIEGRECNECGGTQTKNINEEWPAEWDYGHSRQIAAGTSSWPEDLVFAIAEKNGHKVGQAILRVANSCERCMNTLAHEYGLSWGYPKESVDYQKSGTSCEFCSSSES